MLQAPGSPFNSRCLCFSKFYLSAPRLILCCNRLQRAATEGARSVGGVEKFICDALNAGLGAVVDVGAMLGYSGLRRSPLPT